MNQMTFSDMEYSGRKRVTQKEKFLREMNDIIPWADWVNKILPYYPKGKRGRPPRGIEVMLRMYLLQIWFNLSDEGLEDAIYDSYAMRNFVGINFLEEQVPDATTLLKFRHLLEEHHLGEAIFNDIKERLQQAGLMMRGGTIVDAIIIHSTPSTKNMEGKRDPRNAPTQGVHPTEKTIPNKREEKKPRLSVLAERIPLKILSLNNPRKLSPKNITIRPVTKFTAVLYCIRSLPREPARAPIIINITVNPVINPTAFFTTRGVSFSLPPAKYEIYIGSIGKRHGETNVMIPSRNEMKYCIFYPFL